MRKRWRTISVFLLLLAISLGTLWKIHRRGEPYYKGESLSYWLKVSDQYPDQTWEADQALQSIGTNAIPTLLHRLQARDNPVIVRLHFLFVNQNRFPNPIVLAREHQFEAVRNCGKLAMLKVHLGALVPELVKIHDQQFSPPSPVSPAFIRPNTFLVSIIGAIGANDKEAIPFLLAVANANTLERTDAALALCRIHHEPEMVVPALTEFLGESNWNLRLAAAQGLAAFGKDAQAAVPALRKLQDDPIAYVREAAAIALNKIAPENLAARPD